MAAWVATLPSHSASARTWTDRTGKHKAEADFVDFRDGKVVLSGVDGQIVVTPLEQFSEADQKFVRAEMQRRRAAEKAEVSGEAASVPYAAARQLCTLADRAIDESSGVACSRARPGVLWTHNDSGDAARLFAIDRKGKTLGTWLVGDVLAYDFEDIASFTRDGKHYLLVGDVGNNGLASYVQILYLIEEPTLDGKVDDRKRQAAVVQTINFAYEDDHRNCEALAVDPTTREILLVSKERESKCYVYAMAWPKDDPKKVVTARKIATLKLPAVTAMDVSPDGRRAVVLTYSDAYEYTRKADETWAAAFARRPARIPLSARIQGESICYGHDGKTLYLTSEKLPTPLIEVPVQAAESE